LVPSILKTYLSVKHYSLYAFILFAFLGVTIKFIAISRLVHFFFLAIFVYFCYFYLVHEMTQIRQGIASGVLLLIIPFAFNRQYFKCLFYILIASLFHYSSLFLCLIFFLNKTKQKQKLYAIILLTTFLLAFVDTSVVMTVLRLDFGPFSTKTQAAVNLIEAGLFTDINKLNIFFLLNFFSSAILLYYSELISQKNPYAVLIIKIQIIGLLLFQVFSATPSIAFRINDLLGIVSIISFTFYIYIFNNKWVGFTVTIMLSIIFLFICLFYGKLLNPYSLNSLSRTGY
jgi:hypothetical protein